MRAIIDQLLDNRMMAEALDPWLALHAPGAVLHACAPFDDLADQRALWRPLLAAMPTLERRPDLLMTGRWQNADWIAHTGHFVGNFTADLAGETWRIAATHRPAWLRYGAFEKVADGRIIESWLILDLPALMIAAGQWPLAPSLGLEGLHPAPATGDGLAWADRDAAEAAASLALVEAMIAGLMRYDGASLSSMRMVDFWTPDFHWYGPGGIGSARGHADYERAHQRPFLQAFPDRRGGDHRCRIGDGAYVASTGWPSIRATHTGGGWLGLPPSKQPITMRVMDFWRRDAATARLAENWVFIDLIDFARQLGLDIFARAATMRPGEQA